MNLEVFDHGKSFETSLEIVIPSYVRAKVKNGKKKPLKCLQTTSKYVFRGGGWPRAIVIY